MRKLVLVAAVFLMAQAVDSDTARARRVCYWDCVRAAHCRDTVGSCCTGTCAQTCGLIKNGCPECGKIEGNPLEVPCGN